MIDSLLEEPPEAQLRVETTPHGRDSVAVQIHVAGLTTTRPDIRLHVILVEDSVSFMGTNHVPIHRMLWRASADRSGQEMGFVVRPDSAYRLVTRFPIS